jgi:Copper chaperone
MQQITIKVGGMTCGHCQRRVQDALMNADGVKKATVDLPKGEAIVEYDEFAVNPETLKKVIADAGYEV